MTAHALIYVGPKPDHEIPKLGTLVKDEPRVVTEYDIAAMGGTTVEDFITFVKGLYNRGGVELLQHKTFDPDKTESPKKTPSSKDVVIPPPPASGETAQE